VIDFGNGVVTLSLTTILPTLMENMGYSTTQASLMTAPPYVIACICCLLASYSSSRRNEHGYHVAFCLLVGLFGYILMLTLFDKGKVAIYVSTTVTFCGIFSAFPLFVSWLTINVSGRTKRAMAISFVIGIGEMSGIVTPLVRLLRVITYRITFEIDL
jgi:cyanate permease